MKVISKVGFFVLVYSAASLAVGVEPAEKVLIYRGTSDASAAVAVSEDMFVVADDENNILRVYKIASHLPVFSYDMTDFLDIEPEHPEADIEGATMIGDRIYWITSHGRNKDGKIRPNRYRFFATTVKIENGNVTISPVGKPCKSLVHCLIKTGWYGRFANRPYLGLDKATRFDEINLKKKEREKLAPKREGLNIEGLCASADGKIIYIGFRNPRPIDIVSHRRRALVVPLSNPEGVVEKGQSPTFGEPILWDLEGLGVRSMEYSHYHKAYFIVAGGFDESSEFALYRWSGKREGPPVLVRELHSEINEFSPEALVPFKNSAALLLLSDDGTLVVDVSDASECMEGEYRNDGTCLNKYLTNPNKKYFRGIWLKP